MRAGEESKPLTRADIERMIEEDEVLIERSRQMQAEAPRIIRDAERSNQRILRLVRQLARR